MWSKLRFSCMRITTCLIGHLVWMSSPANTGALGCTVEPFWADELEAGPSELTVAVVQAASTINAPTARAVERRLRRSTGERIEVGGRPPGGGGGPGGANRPPPPPPPPADPPQA